jgi:hyperosmotically inducible protein
LDDRIRIATYRAIYGDPVLSTRYADRSLPPIHIIVRNGNITLRGVVANDRDKNLVNAQVNAITGVFSVTNDLAVDQGS